jgi:hypothetical protein
MNNRPIYLKDNTFRIAYVANGQWQLQKFMGGKGTNKETKGKIPQPHYDPWKMVMRPMSLEEAKAALAAKELQLQGAQ